MQRQPNIIFILSDQQRWDSMGCYGQELNVTPNLDKISEKGVRFENAFTNQPLCTPARACLQTGKYATETGCYTLDIALPFDERTLAHNMSDAGYEVGYIGKWHLSSTNESYAAPTNRPGQQEPFECGTSPIPPERRGGYKDYWLGADHLEETSNGYGGYMYDANMKKVFFPEGMYRVDAQTDFALDYLRTRTMEKPFFLFLSYIEPHWQNDQSTHDAPIGMEENFQDYVEPGDLVGTKDEASWLKDGWRKEYPRYLACVHSLDQNIGRIEEELNRLGMAEHTILIFTSDHGCHFGTRNKGAKDTCHDASIRIPLIAHGPGFTGGRVIKELVSLIDLPPTIMQAGGATLPLDIKGLPLQLLIEGNADQWPDDVFFQISPGIIGRGIRTDHWKYAVKAPNRDGWNAAASEIYEEDFLYDLASDPHERHNLVDDPAYLELRAEMAFRLKKRMVHAGEHEPIITTRSR
ncbi:sulfatase-like hydrolase/transferase [Paenibacillus sp. P36]|uniref:sulfatase-like hydrolase/transferase n=1 Tax=Paenibacillus sp. P36 TaxID=3342538 RepID=UPI0038B28FAA